MRRVMVPNRGSRRRFTISVIPHPRSAGPKCTPVPECPLVQVVERIAKKCRLLFRWRSFGREIGEKKGRSHRILEKFFQFRGGRSRAIFDSKVPAGALPESCAGVEKRVFPKIIVKNCFFAREATGGGEGEGGGKMVGKCRSLVKSLRRVFVAASTPGYSSHMRRP